MLIDTHCHLDASEFDVDRALIVDEAAKHGVGIIVVPAIAKQNFDAVIELSRQHVNCVYALGIHPLFVDQASEDDLIALERYVIDHAPMAIGEIGLDYFITKDNRDRQIYFFTEQLKIAKRHHLPVLLHVRRSVDDVLKYIRRFQIESGIAHAFNGSYQQAEHFITLGYKLGFGGAMTYSRALRIRELARELPLESIVLETDAPDIPPEWVGQHGRNTPLELYKIAQVLADLRGLKISQVIDISSANAIKVLPKIADLYTSAQALH